MGWVLLRLASRTGGDWGICLQGRWLPEQLLKQDPGDCLREALQEQEHRPLVLPGPAMHPHTSPSGEDWPAHCLPTSPGTAVCRAQLEGIWCLKPARPKSFPERHPHAQSLFPQSLSPPPPCGTLGPGDPPGQCPETSLLRALWLPRPDSRKPPIHHLIPPLPAALGRGEPSLVPYFKSALMQRGPDPKRTRGTRAQ